MRAPNLNQLMIRLTTWLMVLRDSRKKDERGQTTAEYALVLLAAATLALLLVAWAAQSGKIGVLFDAVFDKVIGEV